MNNQQHRNALPVGHELHWFRIESVLGQGGFGLTYLARDINLERLVAIKEYMPTQISTRETDMFIHPTSTEVEEDYQWGLDRFISEARILTKFEHPGLVRVFNVFEANNSAYMVMNYEQGKSLKEILKAGYVFSESELTSLLFSLMDGLEAVHMEGFVHRDIKPGNVFIRTDGGPVLLDFGSARQTRGTFTTRTLTNFVSPGYAPIEQYAGKSDRQGPWTDIYGLGATAYEIMTGNMPEASIDRSAMISNQAGDNFIQASLICKGKYSEKLLAAIDHALAFNIDDRPQSITEWRTEFDIDQNNLDTLTIADTQTVTFRMTTPTEKLGQTTQSLSTNEYTPESERKGSTYEKTEKLDTSTDDTAMFESTQDENVHSRYRSFMLAIGAIGIITVGLIGYHTYWRVSQQTIISNTKIEIESIASNKTIDAVDLMSEGEPVASTGPGEEEVVAALLELAGKDISALRLTSPAGNNAYDKYLQVLALDQENLDAVKGIDAITDRYLQMVYTDIEEKNLERAEQYLQKADYLRPRQPKVLTARQALDMAVSERDTPRSVLGKLKKLFN